ncbi:MAG TPA: serine/threonine-protein kinase [Candidatus Didemnitutus sp.]|nr:serine/threonine-protein kinase [Candidatus Didemnitutus sp.]
MNDPAEKEALIFGEALLVPPADRARYLESACAGDPELRHRIESLLAAHDSAGKFMSSSPGAAEAGATPTDRPGTRIGRYKLLQLLGEGGCGVVWMAEQEEPVRRRVALKVIKLGMDTRSVIARFEAERQALALMDHPAIARVLDAGATESGRPYFVMELVAGVPITRYCDERNLSTRERLALFLQVCQAVQHAHQKGIIHRDLKPSNILVTLHDGEPMPKVIDFGIAKATQGRLTDHTLFTALEQFIGTPAYMSPEQAEISGIDVDTRSDIYSLGVLLYELLTGRPPFDPKSLVQAGLDEVRRIIREVEPARPSTRLDTLEDPDRTKVARQRGTAPAQLSVLLRGDLDWIVMKALEKNRARRYDTATGFALDIQRHLQNEPVSARPPTFGYRVGRMLRRHRVAVTTIAAVALALIAGTVVSTVQAIRATRAERQAALERARAAQQQANAENLLEFMLGDLRGQLAKVGRLDVLQAVGDKAMAHFSALPAGQMDEPMLARYAKALVQIGELRMDQQRYADASAAFAEAYDRAVSLVARKPGDGERMFLRGQAEYWKGFVAWKQGNLAAATEWMNRYHDTGQALVALDGGRAEWRSELAYGNHNLAVIAKDRGDLPAARAGFVAELAALEKLASAGNPDADLPFRRADALSWLGGVAVEQGDLAEAVHRYDEQIDILQKLATAEPRNMRWKFWVADTRLFRVEVMMVLGKRDDAARDLSLARSELESLVSHDAANRHWAAAEGHARLLGAMLHRATGARQETREILAQLRPDLDRLAAAEPSDRLLVRWAATAARLDAEIAAEENRPEAWATAELAATAGAKLLGESRANAADRGEYATALLVQGGLAAHAGDADGARKYWQRASEILAARSSDCNDWRLLDPAARVSALLGEVDVARAIVARLSAIKYVPLDPWPETIPLDAHPESRPQG